MLEIDNIRRMSSEKAFIRAYAFKGFDRSAALVDRAVFAIDIIIIFVIFKIQNIARAKSDVSVGRVERERLRFREAPLYRFFESGRELFLEMKLAQESERAVSEGLINEVIISRHEDDECFRIFI